MPSSETTIKPATNSLDFAKQIAAMIASHHEHKDSEKLKHSLHHRLDDDLARLHVNTLHAIFAALDAASEAA